MSFARFGPNSDVHCYKRDHTIMVDVAGYRPEGSVDIDRHEDIDEAIVALFEGVSPIGLPHAGTTKGFPLPQHARTYLLELRELGYRVTDECLEYLREMIKEGFVIPKGNPITPDIFDRSQVWVIVLENDKGLAIRPDVLMHPPTTDIESMNAIEVMSAEMVPINLPYGGEEFIVQSAQEAVDKLLELREIGYVISEDYLEAVRKMEVDV